MKTLFVRFSIFALMAILLSACGGPQQLKSLEDPGAAIEEELEAMKAEIMENGGVAAIGIGSSTRRDLARDNAITDAFGNIAESFEVKVERLRKQFVEEIGSSEEAELNESFIKVTKTVASKIIRGAIVQKTKYVRDSSNQRVRYMAYVLMAITPKTMNLSLLDEMKSYKALYQRFRASQAYKELAEEVRKFEEEKRKARQEMLGNQ